MSNIFDPLAGQWYSHLDKGQSFYITAMDEVSQSVEVQHFDGDLEEYSLSEWRELDIELSDMPENWSGALDITEADDFGTEITDTQARDWNAPLQEVHDSDQDNDDSESRSADDEYVGD